MHTLTGNTIATNTNQQYRTNGLGRVGHEDRSIVSTHLCEVREGTAMVQVEMTDDEAVNVLSERVSRLCDVGEVREPSLHSNWYDECLN